jgi:hypothetical protein
LEQISVPHGRFDRDMFRAALRERSVDCVVKYRHGDDDLRPSQPQAWVDAERELGGTGKPTIELAVAPS